MRITDVRAFLLSSPMPEPIHLTYYGGERTIFKRDAGLVRVSTDGGLKGYGPAPASERAVCPNMKLTTLENVLWSLEDLADEVRVEQDILRRARRAIDRMVAIG